MRKEIIHYALKPTIELAITHANRLFKEKGFKIEDVEDRRLRAFILLTEKFKDERQSKNFDEKRFRIARDSLVHILDVDGYYKEEFFAFLKYCSDHKIWNEQKDIEGELKNGSNE